MVQSREIKHTKVKARPSRLTQFHPYSGHYSQPCLLPMSSLRTSALCISPSDQTLDGTETTKLFETIKTTAMEMERNTLKAVINLVDVSKLVDLTELLEHRVIEECVPLFNCNGTYRKTQKSKLIQKFSLQNIQLQEPYIAIVDIGMIWRMATPSAED